MKTISKLKNIATMMVMFIIIAMHQMVSAQETGVNYQGMSFDSYIAGPIIFDDELKGKVVLFEYWGRNCPPCIASLPHLQDLYSKYAATGKFVIIGAHSQGRDDNAIINLLTQKKAAFPIFQSARVPEAPCPGGIPFAVLIDQNGKIVKKGSPSSLYGDVHKLIEQMPKQTHAIFMGKKSRYYSKLYSKILPGKNSEKALETLKKDAESGESARAKEAQELLEMYTSWYKNQEELIKKRSEKMPSIAYSYWKQLNQMTPETPLENSVLSALNMKDCMAIVKIYQNYNQAAMIRFSNSAESKMLKQKMLKTLVKIKKQKELATVHQQEIDFLKGLIEKNL